ncbi:DUF1266 domain-containing protein [Streptomyces sp. ML-6]|uniref:DUF1266 domain-containing protein n=1 Tax=Streptomyces sp. ML-6 TaxID=2982693 RepID=UPI0024C01BBA|nr:DUF1266 domain-containing protein [Streptomyces sp. ML-6]MDK0518022.1 DUF1266 domain-containing protein [Streptomyces sp. ML-6]
MNPHPHPHFPGGPAHPVAWAAPTAIEHLLHEAGARGDVEAQLRVLAGAGLHILAPKAEVDADPDMVVWRSARDGAGRSWRQVLTHGMLPPWHPEWVFHRVSLKWVAEFGWSDPRESLVVNPGSPVQVLLPTTAQHRAMWLRCYAENDRPSGGRLIALRHGALHGPLAHGLACGAHLAIGNGVPWNEVGAVYHGYSDELELLREAWGITERTGWQEQLNYLLDGRNSPPEPDFALRVRERLRASLGGPPPVDLWRETAAGHAQDLGLGHDTVLRVEELVRRIVRYEARFRADGLLAPDGAVTTTVAYDYGRAVNLARWGLSARFCHPHEAEQAIVHAGALSRSAYTSWESFSAAYTLGRVLRFDDEQYGTYYEQNVTAHHLLAGDEGSPWRNIPWR